MRSVGQPLRGTSELISSRSNEALLFPHAIYWKPRGGAYWVVLVDKIWAYKRYLVKHGAVPYRYCNKVKHGREEKETYHPSTSNL